MPRQTKFASENERKEHKRKLAHQAYARKKARIEESTRIVQFTHEITEQQLRNLVTDIQILKDKRIGEITDVYIPACKRWMEDEIRKNNALKNHPREKYTHNLALADSWNVFFESATRLKHDLEDFSEVANSGIKEKICEVSLNRLHTKLAMLLALQIPSTLPETDNLETVQSVYHRLCELKRELENYLSFYMSYKNFIKR